MNRLRLVTLIETLGRGGAERLVVTLHRHLPRDRYAPRVVTAFPTPDGFVEELRDMGVPVTDLGMRGPRDLPRAAFRLRRMLAAEGAEVVHTHLYFANVVGRLGAWGRARLVTTLHNPDYGHESRETLRFQGRKLLDRATAALARPTFLAVSEEVRRDYERHLGLRDVEVIYNFMDVEPFQNRVAAQDRAVARAALGVPEDAPLALHVGRLHRQKGHDVLLRALAAARARVPALRLVLVGRGPEEGALRRLAGELGVEGAVRFHGEAADVAPLYRAADLFAFPSRYEAFGIALLEAMAAGLPAVASRTGGIVELATGESALLVGVDDVGAVAGALAQLGADPRLRARMGTAAAARALAFDASVWVPRLLDVYERVGRRG